MKCGTGHDRLYTNLFY